MLNSRVNKTVGEESPDLESFTRMINQNGTKGGRSSTGYRNTKAGEIDTMIDENC